MSIKLTNSLAILGLVSVITFFSPAQDTSAADKKSPEQPIISEIRFGADTHGIGGREEGMISLSGAALFQKVSLGASLDSFLSPRPHVGISASTKTVPLTPGSHGHTMCRTRFLLNWNLGALLIIARVRGLTLKAELEWGVPCLSAKA